MQRGEFLKIGIDELENHMRTEYPKKDIVLDSNWDGALTMDFIDDKGDSHSITMHPQCQQLIDIINKYYDFTYNDMMVRHDNEVWFFYS